MAKKPTDPDQPPSLDDETDGSPRLEAQSTDTRAEIGDSTTALPNLSVVGQTFNDFKIIEEIGRGSMGVVYRARQVSLDRDVAIKMMSTEHFDNPVARARFSTEALAVAKLAHPNIIDIYQVGECPFGHYFAMEFVEGQTLDEILKKSKLKIVRLVPIIIRIAEAVDFAHNQGIIHRDLKPANIMIDQFRRPIIMDFGIARMQGSTATLTQRGMGLGTPAFMAPEQAGDDPSKITRATDVYALGAVLYTALTGRPPFDESSALSTLVKVVSDERPPSVRDLHPDVPEELDRICMKCIEKNPENRYPSAWSLAKELRQFHQVLRRAGTQQPTTVSTNVRLRLTSTGKLVPITQSTTLFGRSKECDVVLDAAKVSKKHCQILLADKVFIEDLDSSNGTFLNGKRVQRSSLKDGDELTIAGHRFQVLLN